MSASQADGHTYTTSEVSSIGECVRRWACSRLHRLPDPKHPKTQLGIDMHDVLAEMLRHGPQANLNPESQVGAWARALYPLAPQGAHAELQQNFTLDLGGTDVFSSSFALDWVAPGFIGFGDWKKIGGARWAIAQPEAKPDEQQAALAGDMQANLYTYGFAKVMGFHPHQLVGLRWCCVEAERGKAWPVDGALSFAQAEDWLRVNALPRLRLIRALRALPVQPVSAYPHDITACGGSGRNCAFLGACQFKPSTANLTTETLYQLASK